MPDGAVFSDILVVEDNDDDFEATERALRRNERFANPIKRCRDGLEAWDYLLKNIEDSAPNVPKPGLILLDLNMPGMDGRKLLGRLKNDEELCKIPVVIMTTSVEDEDVEACYRAGANTYIKKPLAWSEFTEAIDRLYDYWFHIAVLPTAPADDPDHPDR